MSNDRVLFKATPLYRITASFQEELECAGDTELEKNLLAGFSERLKEAEAKRDSNFKAIVIIDSLLAIVLSGKQIEIPGVGVKTSDLPALLEILVSISTVGVWACAASFITWLCYTQLIWTLHSRLGDDPVKIEPKWRAYASAYAEISATVFESRVTLRHSELFEPGRGFKVFSWLHRKATAALFLLAPIVHASLLGYSLYTIYQGHGLAPLYMMLYAGVFLGHVLTLALWFGHDAEFSFRLRRKTLGAVLAEPESNTVDL